MKTAALVREEFYCRTAALHYRAWRARVMLTRLTAHVTAKRQNREAFSRRAVGRFRLPRRVEASDLEQAASLDVMRGFADASGVRVGDATGGLCSTRTPERMAGNSVTRRYEADETPDSITQRPSKYHHRKERKKIIFLRSLR